ncbi:MAG: HAD-IIB family hydrolase [Chloroflexota bacterium]
MPHTSRWLLVSDVDDTLLGDDDTLSRLAAALQIASNLIIAYNSSRPCASLRQTLATNPHLPLPDYLIGAMGTEIQEGASGRPVTAYTHRLSQGWSRDRIAAIMADMNFKAHAQEYQTPLKASYDIPDEESSHRVWRRLDEAGLKAKVIFSGGKNLDIIPAAAGKGRAVAYLHRLLDLAAGRVVVAGDSGNDLEMFVAPYKGIIVANAAPKLKELQGDHLYHARLPHAGGVLEGLRWWQVL